jgi:hypothetical protein
VVYTDANAKREKKRHVALASGKVSGARHVDACNRLVRRSAGALIIWRKPRLCNECSEAKLWASDGKACNKAFGAQTGAANVRHERT